MSRVGGKAKLAQQPSDHIAQIAEARRPFWRMCAALEVKRAISTKRSASRVRHVGGLTHYSTRFVKLIEQAVKATAN